MPISVSVLLLGTVILNYHFFYLPMLSIHTLLMACVTFCEPTIDTLVIDVSYIVPMVEIQSNTIQDRIANLW